MPTPAAVASVISALGSSFSAGLKDSLCLHNAVIFFLTSSTIRRRTVQCVLLNGVLFLGRFEPENYIHTHAHTCTLEHVLYAQAANLYARVILIRSKIFTNFYHHSTLITKSIFLVEYFISPIVLSIAQVPNLRRIYVS